MKLPVIAEVPPGAPPHFLPVLGELILGSLHDFPAISFVPEQLRIGAQGEVIVVVDVECEDAPEGVALGRSFLSQVIVQAAIPGISISGTTALLSVSHA